MQLDTDEGDTFVPPAGVVASPSTEHPPALPQPDNHDSENSDAQAAAETTRENEE
jgi:sorting nexin-1/2